MCGFTSSFFTIGLGDTNNPIHYEWDGTIKKLGGSNSFVNPVSGIQTTNGGGFVFASHNCWLPDYVVSGPVITNGDFADCATHDLPECADLLAPSSPLLFPSVSLGPGVLLNNVLEAFVSGNWVEVAYTAIDILKYSLNSEEIALAASLLARTHGITSAHPIEGHLLTTLAVVNSGGASSISARHGLLTALLHMKLIEKKPVEALQICALIEQQCLRFPRDTGC
jgi:hypothetical protein